MAGKLNVAGKLNGAGKLKRTPMGRGVKVGVERIHFCVGELQRNMRRRRKKLVGVILTVYLAVAGKLPRCRKTKLDAMGGSGHGP